MFYVQGKRHGVCETWNSDMTPRTVCQYYHGTQHGVHMEWYSPNRPKRVWRYVNGKLHGLIEDWDENGGYWSNTYNNGVRVR